MADLGSIFKDLLSRLQDQMFIQSEGPYALAETRETRSPQIIAERFSGSPSGAYLRSDPNRAARRLRPDVTESVFSDPHGFIMTPRSTSQDTVTHESTHSVIERLIKEGLGQEIIDSVDPNVDPSIRSFLKNNYPFITNLDPSLRTNEALAFAMEDPISYNQTLEGLFNLLRSKNKSTPLKQLQRLSEKSMLNKRPKATSIKNLDKAFEVLFR